MERIANLSIAQKLACLVGVFLIGFLAFAALAYLFAGLQLKVHEQRGAAGLRQGLTFFLVNIVLDTLVLVCAFHAGWEFFASLTVWLAYLILLIVPWLTGHAMESSE